MRRRFRDDDVNWNRIFDALAHPKIDKESGEEYVDVNPCEMAAIDRLASVCKGFTVFEHPERPLDERLDQDQKFKKFHDSQFAYLKL